MYKKDLRILLVLAGVVLTYFYRELTLSGYYFIGEATSQLMPFLRYIRETLISGSLPFWSAQMEAGYPFLTSTQSFSGFYPFNQLSFFLPAHVSYNIIVSLHAVLNAMAMYIFSRHIGANRAGSFLAGIIFTFSGFFLTRVPLLFIIETYPWVIFIFLFIDKGIRYNNTRYYVLASVAFGIQFFAGTQLWFYTLIALTLYVMYFYYFLRNDKPLGKRMRNASVIVGAIITMTVIFTSIQFLPQYELSTHAGRADGDMSFATASELQLCPEEAVSLFFPKLFGFRINNEYIGRSLPLAECSYFGIFGLMLLLISTRYFRKNHFVLFFSCLGLLSVSFALGKYSPTYYLQYLLPGFKYLRYPMRYLYLLNLSAAVICGLTLTLLTKKTFETQSKARISFFTVLFMSGVLCLGGGMFILFRYFPLPVLTFVQNTLAAITGLPAENVVTQKYYHHFTLLVSRGGNPLVFLPALTITLTAIGAFILWSKEKLTSAVFSWVIVMVTIVDLFIVFLHYSPLIPGAYYTTLPQTARFLAQDKDLYRIYSDRTSYNAFLRYDNWSGNNINAAFLSRETLYPDLNVPLRLGNFERGTSVPLKRYNLFVNSFMHLYRTRTDENLRLLGLMGVKYIISADNFSTTSVKRVYAEGKIRIYQNTYFVPKTLLLHKYIVLHAPHEISNYLQSKVFDPLKTVILEDTPHQFKSSEEDTQTDTVRMLTYLPSKVVIRAFSNQKAIVVVNDILYPGWRAYVDGIKTTLYNANYISRAVLLEKGGHTVHFVYIPYLFILGLIISLSFILIVGYMGFSFLCSAPWGIPG